MVRHGKWKIDFRNKHVKYMHVLTNKVPDTTTTETISYTKVRINIYKQHLETYKSNEF